MNLACQTISALLVTATAPLSCNTAATAETYIGRCDVVFAGDSTLDRFSGDVTNIPLTVLCETNGSGQASLNTRIEISPSQLSTHNGKRDANMYKMFQPDRFPKMIVVVTKAPLAGAKLSPTGTSGTVGTLPVLLTFCGITNEAVATTSNPRPLAGGWEFDFATEVSLKAFKLKPPTMFFGAISVSDTVKVKAHVRVQKETLAP
jgi:hypothetical protein